MSKELSQFDGLKADITQFVAPTMGLKVVDFKTSAVAIEVAKQVKEYINRLDKKRKELVEPLNTQVKSINNYAKTIEEPLKAAEAYIKSQLVAFEIEQERLRQIEFKKAEEEQKRKAEELRQQQEAERERMAQNIAAQEEAASIFGSDEPAEEEAQVAVAALEEKLRQEQAIQQAEFQGQAHDIRQQGIKNTRKTWKCEVADISKVPKEFLIVTLNEKAVLAAARAGVTEIAGVKLWQETTIAIGANTYVPKTALVGAK